MNTTTTLAFIGGGNMAGSIIGGLVNSGWPAGRIVASDPVDNQRNTLIQQSCIRCFEDNAECARLGDVIILAVKPQMLKPVVESISNVLQTENPLVISIAAGIRSQDVSRWAGKSLAMIRVMPNTPALVNLGISGLFATPQVTGEQKKLAQTIMEAVGETVWVDDESLIDSVTGVSGSGPAYFFKLMELMIESGVDNGLTRQTATALVLQTALGAAKLALHGEQPPADLRRQVTSPGGTTEAALMEMEQHGLNQAVRQGINAAVKRSEELSSEFGAL